MNRMTDNLRSGMAALAEEARPMDLRDRALRTSRRLAVRRTVTSAVLAGVAVGLLTTTVALALPSEQAPPVPPVSTTEPAPPVTTESAPPVTTESAPPATTEAPPVESQEPPADLAIPAAAMLQAEDLGSGSQVDDNTVQHHGSVSMLLAYCGRTVTEESVASRLRAFQAGGYLGQEEVYRYGDGGAARVMDNVRSALPGCEQIAVLGSPEHVSELTMVDTDFAGDESILIREVYTTPEQTINRYHVVVRQGDLYAQILLEVESEGQARSIAEAAAQRLCEGTAAC